MKEIKAYIKPFKLDAVMLGLSTIEGLSGMSCNRVDGYGQGRGSQDHVPFTGDDVQLVHYVKIEIVCGDGLVGKVVDTIHREAHTGLRGDGKIFVSDVNDAIRISTGERGEGAL